MRPGDAAVHITNGTRYRIESEPFVGRHGHEYVWARTVYAGQLGARFRLACEKVRAESEQSPAESTNDLQRSDPMSSANLPSLAGRPEYPAPAPQSVLMGKEAVRHAIAELKAIRTFVSEELKEGLDFGVIPGTGTKPTLLLPGAQKVAMYFNTWPDYAIQPNELGEGHVEYIVTARLIGRASGAIVGSGVGSCSTMESKYRFRDGARKCPRCGKEAIIKGKEEFGGGWLCYKKKDGCGTKFADDDRSIVGQSTGKVENGNIHDVRNTVLKMAKKRASVDAAHGLGCLSELFTQDLDDVYDIGRADDAASRRPGADREGPRPRPAHHDDGPPPLDWKSYAEYEIKTRGADWDRECRAAGIDEEAPPLSTIHRLTNAVATAAVADERCDPDGEVITEGRLAGATGKRDRAKAWAAACDLYAIDAEWVERTVDGYLLEKLADARAWLAARAAPTEALTH